MLSCPNCLSTWAAGRHLSIQAKDRPRDFLQEDDTLGTGDHGRSNDTNGRAPSPDACLAQGPGFRVQLLLHPVFVKCPHAGTLEENLAELKSCTLLSDTK